MITIRRALSEEFTEISEFQERMALETENLILNASTVQKGVSAVLADPSKGLYFVAEADGLVVGSLLVTYEWSDWRNGQVLWIQSVYILPEYRNKSIFSRLYNHIKQQVQEDNNLVGIRLYVDKANTAASDIYAHCGMDGDHYRLFEWIKEG